MKKGKDGYWSKPNYSLLNLIIFILKTRTRNFIVSIGVFATAPIVGITIGIILTECFDQNSVNQVAVQSIQAIATGTVIYVVFFEVFPKGKEIGGTGFQHVIAMTLGFLAFLPTLLMRKLITVGKVTKCFIRPPMSN